ncbi:SapC family protein [Aquabacterium sp.]|uniref:SapC family protein n=1 Tax=Aquabacterium sp. TaxID=1872578 RepID=UPI0035AE2830
MAGTMFYERPVALNRERHARFKLAIAPNHSAFAAKTNALPITGTEFTEAARDYPLLFVHDERGQFNAVALVGLRDNENLLIDEAGRWAAQTYVPAFVRRYPFVLSTEEGSDRLTVCIDEAYPGLSEGQGEPLFDAAGAETAYLKNMLEFLSLFNNEVQRTALFANRLNELGLLVSKVVTAERDGHQQTLQGLWVVDEAKYRALEDSQVVELFRQGLVPWIEAHLLSLANLNRLLARLPR